MKIKQLHQNLSDILSSLELNYEEPKDVNRQSSAKFSKLNTYRTALNKLEETGLFKKEINSIRNSPIFTTAKDTLTLNIAEGRQLNNKINDLKKLVEALNSSLGDIGGKISPDSISIKLPPVNDFEDLAKVSADFHKILNLVVVNEQINGKVSIDNVENGSIWLDISLGTSAAVSLIAGISWSSAVIYKKIQEGRLIVEHVRSLKIKNESLTEIQEKQKQVLGMMIDAEARNLYDENFEGEDNEQIERLKNSIKLLSNLIDKGAEIHPALNQPEKVSNLFPKMNQLQTIESKIKKIEN